MTDTLIAALRASVAHLEKVCDSNADQCSVLTLALQRANEEIERLREHPLLAQMAHKLADAQCAKAKTDKELAFVEEMFRDAMSILGSWCEQPMDWPKERWYRYMVEESEADYERLVKEAKLWSEGGGDE